VARLKLTASGNPNLLSKKINENSLNPSPKNERGIIVIVDDIAYIQTK